MTVIVYHNPRYSKSRATLSLLREHAIEPEIIEYLKTPPKAETLLQLAEKLNQPLRSMLRKNETEDDLSSLDDQALARRMAEQPLLIQRPIVVVGARARIGRPPENVLDILP